MKTLKLIAMLVLIFSVQQQAYSQLQFELNDDINVRRGGTAYTIYGSKVKIIQDHRDRLYIGYLSPQYLIHKNDKNQKRLEKREKGGVLQIFMNASTIGQASYEGMEVTIKCPNANCPPAGTPSTIQVDEEDMFDVLSDGGKHWVNAGYVLIDDVICCSVFEVEIKDAGGRTYKYKVIK